MKKPLNYKAYLKREIERIEDNLANGKYENSLKATSELNYLKYEKDRKDRKKQMDISCNFYGNSEISAD